MFKFRPRFPVAPPLTFGKEKGGEANVALTKDPLQHREGSMDFRYQVLGEEGGAGRKAASNCRRWRLTYGKKSPSSPSPPLFLLDQLEVVDSDRQGPIAVIIYKTFFFGEVRRALESSFVLLSKALPPSLFLSKGAIWLKSP